MAMPMTAEPPRLALRRELQELPEVVADDQEVQLEFWLVGHARGGSDDLLSGDQPITLTRGTVTVANGERVWVKLMVQVYRWVSQQGKIGDDKLNIVLKTLTVRTTGKSGGLSIRPQNLERFVARAVELLRKNDEDHERQWRHAQRASTASSPH